MASLSWVFSPPTGGGLVCSAMRVLARFIAPTFLSFHLLTSLQLLPWGVRCMQRSGWHVMPVWLACACMRAFMLLVRMHDEVVAVPVLLAALGGSCRYCGVIKLN